MGLKGKLVAAVLRQEGRELRREAAAIGNPEAARRGERRAKALDRIAKQKGRS